MRSTILETKEGFFSSSLACENPYSIPGPPRCATMGKIKSDVSRVHNNRGKRSTPLVQNFSLSSLQYSTKTGVDRTNNSECPVGETQFD